MNVTDTMRSAQGYWPQLLPALGIKVALNGQHSPCPLCGGKDRFRFDDKAGKGSWICNQCGAGDGLNLVEKALQLSPSQAARQVEELIGDSAPAVTATLTEQDKTLARQNAVKQARQIIAAAIEQPRQTYLAVKGWPGVETLTLAQPLRVGGIGYQRGDLVVPLTIAEGEVVNVQLINAAGDKRTLPGGQVKEAFHCFAGIDNKHLWLTEGYATGLTVHELTGESVYVALSANNLPSLAALLKELYPDATLLIAADRDDNGTGQAKAEETAQAVNGVVALPPVAGDWNDIYQRQGHEATRLLLRTFITPAWHSPFETISDADIKAMSTSEKAELVAGHYHGDLAVPVLGEEILQYDGGAWKVLPPKLINREIATLFQKARAPFSASGINSLVDTLKLMVPQMGDPVRRLIGFRNGVFDTLAGEFRPHRKENWLRTVNNVDYTAPKAGENLADDAPHFWQWLTRAAGHNSDKQDNILAALFMVLANRYDWQLFLEITGPGGSGKSIMATIATMLAGEDNTTSATIDTLESSRERASVVGFSLIILPDQEKWSGDGAGIKAITGGDAVAIDPKYRDAYATHIPAVILAVNNNPMRFSDRSGGVSRRRVIIHFPEVIAAGDRDPQLKNKIRRELSVIVRHLMQRFADPTDARRRLEAQQNSNEALEIKRNADPLVDFGGYLLANSEANGMFMGNANITPRNPRKYVYHAYLSFMEARGYQKPMSLTAFGLALSGILREYGCELIKHKSKNGIQTNLDLSDDSEADWLPQCNAV
ncbi:primase-helicase zinc-binding domain-containing protein [Acerihabitans sp. TG2]|uniref:primase-helicase zinc-binding domain-containing protein n=1 Tax=Acerihabitans sp. TG2 TaxID=3096008 RepID=UPI002B237E6F|nr:primase-helicase zinc-binding domain-containing protein [Acerihabitans sp. TG2]MEA9393500.1 primase-helicase zinc-binding domain-containing protein [Acerihabitans sp. TG2]